MNLEICKKCPYYPNFFELLECVEDGIRKIKFFGQHSFYASSGCNFSLNFKDKDKFQGAYIICSRFISNKKHTIIFSNFPKDNDFDEIFTNNSTDFLPKITNEDCPYRFEHEVL